VSVRWLRPAMPRDPRFFQLLRSATPRIKGTCLFCVLACLFSGGLWAAQKVGGGLGVAGLVGGGGGMVGAPVLGCGAGRGLILGVFEGCGLGPGFGCRFLAEGEAGGCRRSDFFDRLACNFCDGVVILTTRLNARACPGDQPTA
jgi:hypothetical protein